MLRRKNEETIYGNFDLYDNNAVFMLLHEGGDFEQFLLQIIEFQKHRELYA